MKKLERTKLEIARLKKTKLIRDKFAVLSKLDDHDIKLDEAALLISAESEPGLDIPFFLQHLDAMAIKFETLINETSELGVSVTGLTQFIHQGEGFSGNTEDYYDPRNSFLNKVLENKRGIPITLALIHICLGKRLGIQVDGMNFPGRFLVKYGNSLSTIVDPFSGRVLSPADCNTLLKQIAGPKALVKEHYFDTASNKDILVRMLDNLKQIYWQAKSWQESLSCIERQILLKPDNQSYIIQKGVVYEMQGMFQNAKEIYTDLLQETNDEKVKELTGNRLINMQGSGKTIH
ncbi:MAG: regulator of sirC expression with transglutaminase-like and TPR domain [Flavobacterium sp.]|jgi:regulator of sirC expression with transglutaminase-like and TPR domain